MAFIEWSEKLSIGIKVIDDQHKLIEQINILHSAMREGKAKEVVSNT